MYAAAGLHALAVARQYAARGDGTIVRMALKRGAQVILWDDLEVRASRQQGHTADLPPNIARSLYNDAGRLAAYLGYDAVRTVDFPDVDDYAVLNRTALRVQREIVR